MYFIATTVKLDACIVQNVISKKGCYSGNDNISCREPIWAVFRGDFVKACQMAQLSHRVERVGTYSWENWAIHGESWVTQ